MVHLFFPAVDTVEAAVEVIPPRKLAPMRVLIVDDEPGIIDGLMAALRSLDIDTASADSVKGALLAASEFRPHLALVDIRLPDGDGQELGARLRERDPSLKIIFASGHGDARSFVHSDRTAFLQKPFAIDGLVDAMVGLGCGVGS
jgi:two-component system OmpR family response regulator